MMHKVLKSCRTNVSKKYEIIKTICLPSCHQHGIVTTYGL